MAEKNRLAQAAKNAQAANEMMGMGEPPEPTKLMVSELHPHIAEADVREMFAPFGELAEVALMKDPTTGASLGQASVPEREREGPVQPRAARVSRVVVNNTHRS